MHDLAIALVGIDVDGTLVGSSGEVPEAVWQAAARARQHGVHLALCSGRPAFGIAREYAQQLESDGWHVFQNGASVVHLATQETRSAPLPRQQVELLIERARAGADVLELYGHSSYVAESTSPWAFQHARLLGVAYEPRPFESLQEPVVRAQWLLTAEQAAEFKALPHPGLELAQSSSPLMPQTRFVGLTRAGVSKGTALRTVAQQYGIPLRAVMYVGDSGNDLSALQIVGCPVAMGNADAAVRAIAHHTVGHVDEGGLAQALGMAVELAAATNATEHSVP